VKSVLALVLAGVSSAVSAFPLTFDRYEAAKWTERPTFVGDPSEQARRLTGDRSTFFIVPTSNQSMVWCRILATPKTARFLAVRYSAVNLSPNRYFLFAFDNAGGGFELSRASQMRADGTWTTALYDLQAVTVGKPLTQLCMTVAADNAAPAQIAFDHIDLVDSIIESAAD
jgi:hypothetical protein